MGPFSPRRLGDLRAQADASDLAAKSLGDLGVLELELRSKSFFGQEGEREREKARLGFGGVFGVVWWGG